MERTSYRHRWLAAGLAALTLAIAILPASIAAANAYTVRSGDSLWLIAQRHGTTVAALQSASGISGTLIRPGQRLTIPGTATAANATYTVRAGDSLWKIATRHGTTVAALQAANGIWTTVIYPGQRLVIPGAGAATATVASRSGGMTMSATDVELLARLVRAEAEAEPYEGQVAVAAVVLNRINSSRFPSTMRGVVYAPGQFCVVDNGRISLPALETSRRAAQDALAGRDPSRGALYFYNPAGTTNAYMLGLTRLVTIGSHVFAR